MVCSFFEVNIKIRRNRFYTKFPFTEWNILTPI